jgi:hypothetical protein
MLKQVPLTRPTRHAFDRGSGYQLVMIEVFHGLGHVSFAEFRAQDLHDPADRENTSRQTKKSANLQQLMRKTGNSPTTMMSVRCPAGRIYNVAP